MLTKFAITSALEILAVVLLMLGFVYNEKLIELESRIARRAAKLAVAVGAAARRYLERTEVTPTTHGNPCPTKGDDRRLRAAAISRAIAAAPDDAHSVTIPAAEWKKPLYTRAVQSRVKRGQNARNKMFLYSLYSVCFGLSNKN